MYREEWAVAGPTLTGVFRTEYCKMAKKSNIILVMVATSHYIEIEREGKWAYIHLRNVHSTSRADGLALCLYGGYYGSIHRSRFANYNVTVIMIEDKNGT